MASKPINLRLDQDLHERFLRLRREFPQLAPAALLRLLLAAELQRPIEDQITTIVEQLRKPKEKSNRVSDRVSKNTRNRVEGR